MPTSRPGSRRPLTGLLRSTRIIPAAVATAFVATTALTAPPPIEARIHATACDTPGGSGIATTPDMIDQGSTFDFSGETTYVPTDAEWAADGDGAFNPKYIEWEADAPVTDTSQASYGTDTSAPSTLTSADFALDAYITIDLACGGVAGAVGGEGIAMARPSAEIPEGTYGRPGAGNVVKTELTPTKMRDFVKNMKVPWPKTGSSKASDMAQHDVYTIWGESGGEHITWKYGITKNGATRPKSQLAACSKALGITCDWKWVRRDVDGWLKARRWEAHHAARYKATFGHCPPGMVKCL